MREISCELEYFTEPRSGIQSDNYVIAGKTPLFRISRLGRPQLCLGSYRYCTNSVRGSVTRWRCTSQPRGCRAKLTTCNSVIVRQLNIHNH
ncbi:unnamed protein product [Chrysodeixis includens]|uniref:FLYWCH-type domain-containing protein n=1 Tax=Chrysodeixis includens TaxID=689277 RepID=A0A9P0FRW4_CHRIL|nr:unnamed protein product [Chrysodeixis includens]